MMMNFCADLYANWAVEDFTQSQYRMLMAHLQESMAQDDQEPLEHLGSALGADLRDRI